MATEILSAPQEVRQRNDGIELLRAAATLSIITYHILTQGGVRYETVALGSYAKFSLCYLLECFTLWGSTAFALISGYLYVRARFKVKSLVSIYLETVFYMLVITAVFAVFAPEQVTYKSWTNCLFPFIDRQYWYISAYAGVFIMIPFLNAAVNAMPRRALTLSLLAAAVLFFVLPPFTTADAFNLNSGYSVFWMALMYVVGAYIRLYAESFEKIKTRSLVLILLLCGLFTWGLKMAEILSAVLTDAGWLTQYLADRSLAFQKRSALPLAALGVCVFLLFLRRQPSAACKRVGEFLSRHSLGVYLIHVQPLLFGSAYYFFSGFAALPLPLIPLAVIAAAAALFAVCTGLDCLRALLFRALGADRFCQWCAEGLSTLGGRIAEKIER